MLRRSAGGSLLVTAMAGTTAHTSALWSGDTDGATVNGLRITIPGDRPRDVAITFDALGLGLAVEQEGRVWTTDGEAPWYAVTTGTHDGVDAERTGAIPDHAGACPLRMAERLLSRNLG